MAHSDSKPKAGTVLIVSQHGPLSTSLPRSALWPGSQAFWLGFRLGGLCPRQCLTAIHMNLTAFSKMFLFNSSSLLTRVAECFSDAANCTAMSEPFQMPLSTHAFLPFPDLH